MFRLGYSDGMEPVIRASRENQWFSEEGTGHTAMLLDVQSSLNQQLNFLWPLHLTHQLIEECQQYLWIISLP